MDLGALAEKYGWALAVLLYFGPPVWRFLSDRVWPQAVKDRDRELSDKERADQAERDARALLLKSQIERENRESDRRMKLEERLAAAYEQTNNMIQALTLTVNIGGERMNALIAAHTQHANFVFNAHIEIKDKLEELEDLLSQKQRVDELETRLNDTQEKIKGIGTQSE